MENVNVDKMIYAFTGLDKDSYLQNIIDEWQEYIATGGDPDCYKTE